MEVPDICWTDLDQAINNMPDNTPGMDGVRKGDLLLLSLNALWLLTQLLDAQFSGLERLLAGLQEAHAFLIFRDELVERLVSLPIAQAEPRDPTRPLKLVNRRRRGYP